MKNRISLKSIRGKTFAARYCETNPISLKNKYKKCTVKISQDKEYIARNMGGRIFDEGELSLSDIDQKGFHFFRDGKLIIFELRGEVEK